MNFFDQWLKEPKKRELHRAAITNIDKYDLADMEAIEAEYKDFRVARDKLCETVETGGYLTSDTFMSLYKVEPQLRPVGDMRPTYVANCLVQGELQKTAEWERLRSWTEGDIVNAAAGFVSIEDDLEALFDKVQTEQRERAQDLERRQKELQDALDDQQAFDDLMASQMANMTDEELAELTRVATSMAEAIQALIDQLAADAAEMEADLTNVIHLAMPGMRRAMSDASDEAEAVGAIAGGFGMEAGQLKRMSATERLNLAHRLSSNQKFKLMAELIGPMTRIASAEQTRKVYHSFEEVYDIGVGKDLSRILPSEMLALANPLTKLDFYRRYTEGKLLQYEMKGTEKVGKGGIIFEMDNSSSMMGMPEIWAKVVGLATLSIARAQKRSFIGYHFSSRHELERFDFSTPEKITMSRVLDFAEKFFCGGTDFQVPLTAALGDLIAEEQEKGFIEGDIVFVTDGYCSVDDAWLDAFVTEKERLGFRVWGILIGAEPTSPLTEICDSIVTINDLLSGDPLRGMFRDL